MKKLFQNQAVAWTVLILAVALACVWGISRKSYYEGTREPRTVGDRHRINGLKTDARIIAEIPHCFIDHTGNLLYMRTTRDLRHNTTIRLVQLYLRVDRIGKDLTTVFHHGACGFIAA